MASKIQDLIKEIGELSVFELSELVKSIEETFNVSAAAAVAVAAPAEDVAQAKEEEKSQYKVELVEVGADKIKVIKAVKAAIPTMGLVEAKKAVEDAPFVLAEAANKEDAFKIKADVEAAGAKIKLS